MCEKDTILINIMYTGDYANKNIGHEIINLYKTDNKENYIYITPFGRISSDKFNKVKTVLLARGAGTNCIQSLAKAEVNEEESEKFKYIYTKYKNSDENYKRLRKDFYKQVFNIDDIERYENDNKYELANFYLKQIEQNKYIKNLDNEKISKLELNFIKTQLLNSKQDKITRKPYG